MTDHFILSEPVWFEAGDALKPRYRSMAYGSSIVGFDVVSLDGTRTPLPGRMVREQPLDERARMPITVSDVQFWYGWDR